MRVIQLQKNNDFLLKYWRRKDISVSKNFLFFFLKRRKVKNWVELDQKHEEKSMVS